MLRTRNGLAEFDNLLAGRPASHHTRSDRPYRSNAFTHNQKIKLNGCPLPRLDLQMRGGKRDTIVTRRTVRKAFGRLTALTRTTRSPQIQQPSPPFFLRSNEERRDDTNLAVIGASGVFFVIGLANSNPETIYWHLSYPSKTRVRSTAYVPSFPQGDIPSFFRRKLRSCGTSCSCGT